MSEEEVLLQLLPGELSESSSQCATSCASVTDRRKFGPRGASGRRRPAPHRSSAHHNPAQMTESRQKQTVYLFRRQPMLDKHSVDPLILISSAAAQLGTYFLVSTGY